MAEPDPRDSTAVVNRPAPPRNTNLGASGGGDVLAALLKLLKLFGIGGMGAGGGGEVTTGDLNSAIDPNWDPATGTVVGQRAADTSAIDPNWDPATGTVVGQRAADTSAIDPNWDPATGTVVGQRAADTSAIDPNWDPATGTVVGQRAADTSALSPDMTAEFIQAVKDGKVSEFLQKNPNLTPAQITGLNQALNAAISTDAPEGSGTLASTLWGLVSGEGIDPGNLPIVSQITGLLKGGTEDEDISSERAAEALQAVTIEANKRNIIIAGEGSDLRTLAEQYVRNQPMLGDQPNPYADESMPIPDEILNAVITTLAKDNPGLGEGTIATGTAVRAGPQKYVVEAGDSMSSIATQRGVSLADLMRANPNVTNASIAPGMALVIPSPATPTTGTTGTPGGTTAPPPGTVLSPTQDRSQPTNPATDPYNPATTDPANAFDTDFGDPLLQSIFKQGLLPVELIQSKGYTPGTSAVLEDQYALMDALAQLSNLLSPGRIDYTGEGMSDLFSQVQAGNNPLDADALITEALSDPAYRAAEMADPREAFGVLAAARSGSVGNETLQQLYTGGYADQLQLEYEKTYGGTAAEQRPTLLEFLISKGL